MARSLTATHWGNYEVVARDGRVERLEPVGADPDPSPIGPGTVAALDHPSRLLEPMVRKGWLEHGPRKGAGGRGAEPFVAVSLDTAYELAARELERVKREHGNQAIYGGSYGWASAGRFHHAQSQVHRFLNLLGGYTYSVGSYSAGAMEVILPHVIGGGPQSIWMRGPMWEDIAEHGRLVVAFGGIAGKNAQVSPGGVALHTTRGWQQRCRDAGVDFVNVSPARDDADSGLEPEWLPLRPNTDVALMLGLAHTLVVEGRHDADFAERCCVGFDRFRDYLLGTADGTPKDAAWAAAITEVPEDAVRDLARRIAERRTVITVSLSLQRADHGEQSHWLGVTLAALSGSMGRPGGGFAAALGISQLGTRFGRHAVAALPQGQNGVRSFIPVARVTDMLLSPGGEVDYDGRRLAYPDVRLVYWCGGNPFHHQQDLNRLVRAWQEPETVIVHDSWWNPLARFADIVFPVATTLERNDFAAGSFDTMISAMHRAVEPPAGVPTDYEIFSELAGRLGFREELTEGRTAEEWVRELYGQTRERLAGDGVAIPPFEEFWETGGVELPPPPRAPSDFAALREDAHANPIPTPSGRIEIFSETIDRFGYDDCPGHPLWLEPAEWLGSELARRFPLHLLSNQPRTRLHSQYDHGALSQASKVAGREPILIAREDAAARGIADGDVVRVHNDRGAFLAGAVVTDALRPRVLLISTGAWYDPVEPGVPGSLDRHGNPNVVSLDKGTSRLAQGSSAQTALVEIERFEGEPPPVLAFAPPRVERPG